MKTKEQNNSLEIAKAVGRAVLEDIGRQFCRRNRAGSFSRRDQRRKYFERVLSLRKQGGLSDESRDNN